MSWQPISNWRQLGGVAGLEPDPYLIWAQLTGWAHLLIAHAGAVERDEPVVLLLELRGDTMPQFRLAFNSLTDGEPALMPAAYVDGRFATVWVSRRSLDALLDPMGSTGGLIRRAEISLPIRALRPTTPPLRWPTVPATAGIGSFELRGRTALGVIDTGCPFARRSLCNESDSGLSTRVAAIWQMQPSMSFNRGELAAAVPARMGYGLELRRRGAGGLDDWLARFGAARGHVDEQACYVEAGLPEMRSRVSHGAHMLDLLAGPVPLGHRVAMNADSPPDWQPTGDAASDPAKTDIVFVQLPASALADSSGAWLGSHVLDAVSYLAGCLEGTVERLLINLSYGCTTGPRDGSSIVERALDAVVDAHAGKVVIAVAAGNSYASRGHAILSHEDFDEETRLSTPIVWRVLPGSETPSFMQLWLPRGSAGSAMSLRIASPSGEVYELNAGTVAVWPDTGQPQVTAIFLERSSRGEDSPMILVAIAPTDTMQGDWAPALHGDWTMRFRAASTSSVAEAQIHAYIARNDHDLGMPARGRQSFFVDPCDEPSRHLRGCADDAGMRPEIDGVADRRGAIVRRRGTLNGIASGQKVRACAGYRLSDESHAAYSSAGMASTARGTGPESASVTDESAVLRGVRAGGNASGAVFRLVGTSTAPPQRLRRLAAGATRGGTTLGAADPLNPQDLWGDAGRLDPWGFL